MDRQRSPLPTDGEDLLQAALSDAFSVGDLPRQPAVVAVQETQSATLTAVEAPATTSSEEEGMSSSAVSAQDYDAWKAEYDAQLSGWRQESAKAREHAEAERARWEEIRQREKREGGAASEAWESVTGSAVEELGATLARAQGKSAPQTEVGSDSPSPADVRDLVEGEKPGAHTQEYIEAALPRAGPSIVIDTAGTPSQAADATPAGHADTTSPTHAHDPSHASSSPRWEDVTSSLTSSFPSMSFPETSRPESPEHQHAHQHHHHHHDAHVHEPHHEPRHAHTHAHAHEHTPPQPTGSASATLAVFDSTLSVRTRTWALVSALAINMLLPFVNGVMLGFGEIFAKNVVVGWFGFGKRGSGTGAAANVGIGARRPGEPSERA